MLMDSFDIMKHQQLRTQQPDISLTYDFIIMVQACPEISIFFGRTEYKEKGEQERLQANFCSS